MAELKKVGRQIAQPNAPDISAAGEAYGNLGKAIQATSSAVGNYVDSVNRLDANVQYSETLNTLNKELVTAMSTENIAKGKAYERYIQSAEAIIEGGMQNAPRKYKVAFEQELRQKVNGLGLKVATADLNFQESLRKSEGMATISTHMDSLNEAIAGGNIEEADHEETLIHSTLADLEAVGAIDPYAASKIKKQIADNLSRVNYTSHFENLLRSDPVEADKYLANLAQHKPESLTYEQYKDVQSSLLKQRTNYYNAVDAASTLGLNEYKVAFDSGQINSGQDIDDFIVKSELEGRFFSPNDKLKMQDMLLNKSIASNKKAETLIAIDNAVASNPDALYSFSTKQLNEWYQVKAGSLNEEIAKQKEANPDVNYPSSLAVKATIASKLPVPVQAFQREMGDKLTYGTTGDFEEALKVGEQLKEISPKTFTMLPRETQAYQAFAASLYGSTSLSVAEIKEFTNKAVLQQDTATKERIEKGLSDIKKTRTLPNLYKDIYDVKTFNAALQPQYDNMVNVYDSFYRMTGDKDISKSLTTDYMNVRSGKSKYIPKGDITKDPIENTAAYQESPTFVENQMAVALREVIHLNELERKENGSSNTYEWPDHIEMPDFSSIKQQEFYDKPIFNILGKNVEPQIKVNGKNRKLFFMNPNTNLEDNRADQRQMYYEDEYGVPRPLFVYQEKDYGNGLIRLDAGIPSVEFQSVSQLAPEVAAKNKQTSSVDEAVRHLKSEFKANRKEKTLAEEEMANNPAYPARPDPFKQAKDIKQYLEEEESYVAKGLPKKLKDIESAKQNQINKLIGGK